MFVELYRYSLTNQ